MPSRLCTGQKLVGIRQLRRGILRGQVAFAYLACDADPLLIQPLRLLCEEAGIPVEDRLTMTELGNACGISVKASAAGLLRQSAPTTVPTE